MGVFKSDKTTENNQKPINELRLLKEWTWSARFTFCFELTNKILRLLITQYLQEQGPVLC